MKPGRDAKFKIVTVKSGDELEMQNPNGPLSKCEPPEKWVGLGGAAPRPLGTPPAGVGGGVFWLSPVGRVLWRSRWPQIPFPQPHASFPVLKCTESSFLY